MVSLDKKAGMQGEQNWGRPFLLRLTTVLAITQMDWYWPAIDLRDLCSLANQHRALGAIMTFTHTDYNFKWLFKKNPWWTELEESCG